MTSESTTSRRSQGIREVRLKTGERRYRLTIDVGSRPDGRRDQRTKTFATKREAVAYRAKVIADRDRGSLIRESRTTFGEYATSWLAGRRDVRASTLSVYERALKPFTTELGTKRLQALTREDLDSVVQTLTASGGRKGAGASPSTIAQYLTIVSTVLSGAVAEGLVRANVARQVRKPRQVIVEQQSWTRDEVLKFLEYTSELRLSALFRLLAVGARRGEVLGLTWQDVDFEAGTVSISRSRGLVRNRIVVDEPKTPNSRRVLYVDEPTVRALKRLRATQAAEHLSLRQSLTEQTFVATNEACEPIHPDTFRYTVRRQMQLSGVPVIRVHDMRHTSVTLMLAAGLPINVVAKWHGHDAAVMLRRYSHVQQDHMQSAATVVASILATGS